MVEAQLGALSVEVRREIYRLLLERPRSVGELAEELPVSRPAVSQHLKVLLEAQLAYVETVGTRHVYTADPEGMARLRDWVDGMWQTALGSFARFAGEQEEGEMAETGTQIEPVRKTIVVPGTPAEVFGWFTDRIDEWWPKVTHSVSGDDTSTVIVEGHEAGRVYERSADGEEHEWGMISVWEPGSRIEMTWHPGLSAEHSTHLAIGFEPSGASTIVTLVHDGWEARGVNGPETRDNYERGWDKVLAHIPGI